MAEHSKLPWSLCGEGKCTCLTISTPDYPIAKVTSGKWGDDYPSLRMVGGSIEGKFEAFMEQITYGEINRDLARANAQFIVLAVNNHDALVKALQSVWDFMNIDVKSGDADLWTEEYDALHAEVCAALNATIDIPSFDPVAGSKQP